MPRLQVGDGLRLQKVCIHPLPAFQPQLFSLLICMDTAENSLQQTPAYKNARVSLL